MTMHNPCHPGELLTIELIRDEDGNRINSVQSLAEKLGCHRSTLNRILAGTASITPEMAVALESIGAGSAEHWLAMQANYDLFQIRKGHAA